VIRESSVRCDQKMLLFKFLVMIFAMALAFFKAESKYLHPRFRGMMIEKSFDEASGELVFVLYLRRSERVQNSYNYIPDCSLRHLIQRNTVFLYEQYLGSACSAISEKENCARSLLSNHPSFVLVDGSTMFVKRGHYLLGKDRLISRSAE